MVYLNILQYLPIYPIDLHAVLAKTVFYNN